jgi:hypothetical protein
MAWSSARDGYEPDADWRTTSDRVNRAKVVKPQAAIFVTFAGAAKLNSYLRVLNVQKHVVPEIRQSFTLIAKSALVFWRE